MVSLDGLDELLDEETTLFFTGCQHPERTHLLERTACWIYKAYVLYKALKFEENFPIVIDRSLPPLILTHIEDLAFGAIDKYKETRDRLHRVIPICEWCILQREHTVDESIVKSFGRGLIFNRPGTGYNEDDCDSNREPEDLSEDEEESGLNPRAELLEFSKQVGGWVVKGRKAPGWSSRLVQPYRFQEERSNGVVKAFNPKFDSYHTGPTAETVLEMYKDLYADFLANPDVARWSTANTRFADYGYRRTTGGFLQFYLNKPSVEEQLQHFFSLPPKDVLDG